VTPPDRRLLCRGPLACYGPRAAGYFSVAMENSDSNLDQVRKALSGAAGRTRSWTRSTAPRPAPGDASINRLSSFVRNASRYIPRPPKQP
jgi:hypothetical protein